VKLEELKLKFPKIGIYGPAGTGKTAFVLTAGKSLKYVDCDRGVSTGFFLKDKWREDRLQVDVEQVFEPDPLKSAVGWTNLKTLLALWTPQIMSGKFPWDILAIDSLTSVADFCVRNVMAVNGGVLKQPQIQHWGQVVRDMDNFVLQLRALPITVVLVAHQQVRDEDGTPMTEIGIPTKVLPNKISCFLDEIWHAKIVPAATGRDYICQTCGTAGVVARTRHSVPDNFKMSVGLTEALRLGGFELPTREPSQQVK
jgi:hypothetical protein